MHNDLHTIHEVEAQLVDLMYKAFDRALFGEQFKVGEITWVVCFRTNGVSIRK